MLRLLMWILVKIPLLVVAIVAGVRLAYLKFAFNAIEGECVRSEPANNGKFQTTYQFHVCENNVIETIEGEIITSHQVDVGYTNKMLSRKINPRDICAYNKIYNAIAWILIPLILIFTI